MWKNPTNLNKEDNKSVGIMNFHNELNEDRQRKQQPRLAEYFLDEHTDEFKNEIYFKKGDVVLDPFCGSGTTLVEASELGIHAIGIDISEFNAFISNSKVDKYDFKNINQEINKILKELSRREDTLNITRFEKELGESFEKGWD